MRVYQKQCRCDPQTFKKSDAKSNRMSANGHGRALGDVRLAVQVSYALVTTFDGVSLRYENMK